MFWVISFSGRVPSPLGKHRSRFWSNWPQSHLVLCGVLILVPLLYSLHLDQFFLSCNSQVSNNCRGVAIQQQADNTLAYVQGSSVADSHNMTLAYNKLLQTWCTKMTQVNVISEGLTFLSYSLAAAWLIGGISGLGHTFSFAWEGRYRLPMQKHSSL